MPNFVAGQHSHIRPVKIYVDSTQGVAKTSSSSADYTYSVDLPERLENVVALELTGFTFNDGIAPTFLPSAGNSHGNNMVDFQLVNGGTTETFSFTWPSNAYTYENVVSSWLSYIDVLPQLLTSAIAGSGTFAGKVTFACVSDPNERTIVTVQADTGAFGTTDAVELVLLFSSGVNSIDSAWEPMGFTQDDYTSSSVSGLQSITSPNNTDLRPFRYIDVYVDQVPELRPLQRVFFKNMLYYGTTQNDVTKPVRLLQNPVPYMQRLDIILRLKDQVAPLGGNRPHDLVFTAYCLANETTLPQYAQQVMVL